MGEYKYYKSTCEIRYIDYRLYDAILAEECPRKLFPGDEGLKKCQKLRQEWSKYPATMAYIDALVWFERYRYYIKKDSALSEKYSLEFAQKFEFFKNILDKREYDKRETNLWQDNKMNLIFEGDTLIAKYKIISKCGELSDMAYQFENSLEYDEAMKYHFWALKFCHNKNSFERIEAIINTKELIYRKLISEGDSLCSIREYEQGKNKYREAVNYTLFPNLAISRIDRCRPPTTFPAEILPPVITPQDIFDVVKGIISTYNTINFNELPGQKITFQLDSRDRKKINVFIVSNIDEADFVIHASYYPSGSYKFKNEEIENGLIINILKTLDKVFGTHLDTSGIEIDITGSADFSGFNGEKLKVEDEYKNKSILVEDIRGGRFQLDDLINGSDYDKNLGLAFLRGYRKQQAILEECSEINLRYSLQAKVEGQYGSKYRNVKVVLKMKLR